MQKSLQELCQKFGRYGYKVLLVFEQNHRDLGTALECIPFANRQGAEDWLKAMQAGVERGDRMDYTVGAYMIIDTGMKFNF